MARRAPARRTPTAYQTYQAGSSPDRLSSNITYENNYCVRVTGQCFIAQNDQRGLRLS